MASGVSGSQPSRSNRSARYFCRTITALGNKVWARCGARYVAATLEVRPFWVKAIIERIERLEEEKKAISDDIRDVYAESKGNGFDVKALRTIVRLRKQDPNERQEQESILETYMQALGML